MLCYFDKTDILKRLKQVILQVFTVFHKVQGVLKPTVKIFASLNGVKSFNFLKINIFNHMPAVLMFV